MLAALAQHGWASGMAWLTAVAAGRGDGGMRGRVTHHPVVCLAASWLSGSGSRRHSLLRPQLGTPPPDRLTLLHSVGQAPGSAQLREWSRPPDPPGGKSYAGSWPRAASRQTVLSREALGESERTGVSTAWWGWGTRVHAWHTRQHPGAGLDSLTASIRTWNSAHFPAHHSHLLGRCSDSSPRFSPGWCTGLPAPSSGPRPPPSPAS